MNRQLFATTLAAFAIVTTAPSSYSAENDLAAIKAEITKRHDEAVTRLQDWIKQVSIAAERAATTLVLSHWCPEMRRQTLDELAALFTRGAVRWQQHHHRKRRRRFGPAVR